MTDPAVLALLAVLVLLAVVNLVVLLRQTASRREGEATRTALALVQRALEVGQRTEAEVLRRHLVDTERALAAGAEAARMQAQHALTGLTERLVREQGEQRTVMEAKLREMGDQAALRLAAIQHSVTEQLAQSVDRSMQTSFQRVIDQFAQVQRAMGDVQAMTAQIGDLRRVFTNVKSRGFWGEMQLRALLTDSLPAEAWEANRRLRDDSDEVVEFVLLMPSRTKPAPVVAVDAKFPAEDYDRLLLAAETGDTEAERAARKALETRLRLEARKIAAKYIVQPVTVDYAIMYLPTDGLYVEAARMPGLIQELNSQHRIVLMGPSLLPPLLRTLQLGAMTLTIEQRAADIQRLLGAVRQEFGRMDEVLGKLEKQTGTVSTTLAAARTRTRAMARTLREIPPLADIEAEVALDLDAASEEPSS